MKKINLKNLIVGIIIGTIGLTTVFAAGGIKSAVYSDSKIYIKGNNIPLSDSLAFIVKEGSNDAKAYAPVRELLEKLGYLVEWNESDGSIQLYPKSLSDTFDVYEYQNHPLPIIGADYDEDIYLYSLRPNKNGAVITYKNISKYFDWRCYSPRMIMPQMKVLDYDGDGQKEIAVSLNNHSGTYINVDELHIVKLSDNDLSDYEYNTADSGNDIADGMYYDFYEKGEKIYMHLQSENNAFDVDLQALYPDEQDINAFDFFIYTSYLRFALEDDGRIIMSVDLCVNTKTMLSPQRVAVATADVLFSNGKFSISNIEITASESDITVKAEVLPTNSLKFVNNSEIDAESDEFISSNINENSWRDYCPVTYTDVLIVDSVSGKSSVINAKKGYFQTPVGEDLYDYEFQFQLLPISETETYALSDNVKFYFSSANDKTVIELKDRKEFSEKVGEGYTAWEVEIKDNKITSLKNMRLRQTAAYRVISAYTTYGEDYLTVVPVIRNEHPSLLNNYRFDEIVNNSITFKVSSYAKITVNDLNGNKGTQEIFGTFSDFSQQLKNSRYCYLAIEDGLITKINSIYLP